MTAPDSAVDHSALSKVIGDGARILVMTATYNERDNVDGFCRRVVALRDGLGIDLELLVIDDASPDGTGSRLDELAEELGSIRVVHRPRKLGLGTAHLLAFVHAIQNGFDFLVTLDADFSHEPERIPELLSKLESADFATGSRYCPGGRCDYRGYRRMVSAAANRAARALLGIPLYEFTTSFRAFRVDSLRRIDLSSIRSQGYSFFLESVVRLARAGFRVAEMPIHFHDRLAGESKIPKLEIFRGIKNLLSLVLGRRSPPSDSSAQATLHEELSCPSCRGEHIVERFPQLGEGDTEASAFQCTSMEHNSKPRVVSCLGCGLQWVPLEPRHEELEALYADVVDVEYVKQAHGREKTFREAYAKIEDEIPSGGKLLEVGSYCGLFLEVAQEKGWTVRGVEPSRWASGVARAKGFDVHCGTVDDEFPKDELYDVIVLWDVLEHVRDPQGLLDQLRARLREGGKLCFSTLDVDNWFPRLLGRRWPWYMDMHLFYFTRRVLETMLDRSGFRTTKVCSYCHYIPSPYLVQKIASLLPFGLGRILLALKGLAPSRLLVPFRFGDIKLLVAEAVPQLDTPEIRRLRAPPCLGSLTHP
ncbi:MAG: methyltransferase domain-containing protein [Planctomycetota bacterium]